MSNILNMISGMLMVFSIFSNLQTDYKELYISDKFWYREVRCGRTEKFGLKTLVEQGRTYTEPKWPDYSNEPACVGTNITRFESYEIEVNEVKGTASQKCELSFDVWTILKIGNKLDSSHNDGQPIDCKGLIFG